MRIQPVRSAARHRHLLAAGVPLTDGSELRDMIIGMITSKTLGAFTAEVAPTRSFPVRPVQPARSTAPVAEATPQTRILESTPALPSRPLPRGSLVDLRV